MKNVIILEDDFHMAQLMKDSDLAIGAAGGTTWEQIGRAHV